MRYLICVNRSVAVSSLVEINGDEHFTVRATDDLDIFAVCWCLLRKEIKLEVFAGFALVVKFANLCHFYCTLGYCFPMCRKYPFLLCLLNEVVANRPLCVRLGDFCCLCLFDLEAGFDAP